MGALLTKITIPFWKMHGAGNDFVVLDAISNPLPHDFDFAKAAELLCTRHFGVGSDGLLLLDRATTPDAQVRMRMWNPDGSEDMCGNGLRCVAQLAHDNDHVTSEEFITQTLAGLRSCITQGKGQVRIEMGQPNFAFEAIPMLAIQRDGNQQYTLTVGDREFPNCVSLTTGSTHTAIFIDEELSESDFQKYSPLIENHTQFPERTTVLWTQRLDDNKLRVRIWERGVGETLACGTGACAVAVAAQTTGRAQGAIAVQSKGGVLQIEWNAAKDEPIFMTGPTKTVFAGVLTLEVA